MTVYRMLVPALVAVTSLAATPDRPVAFDAARANVLIAEASGAGRPAIAAAIIRPEGVVWTAYAGESNLDYRIAADASSRFYFGSLAKPFVAAATILLAEDGLVDRSAPVAQYLPQLPEWARVVRVENLLHMNSGIRDYLKLRDFSGAPKYGPFDNDSAMQQLRRQKGLVASPGARYQYSNSNYILLWEILEKVSSRDPAALIQERIFAPLGMASAFFESDYTSVVPSRVVSYRQDGDGRWHRLLKTFSSTGDGGAWGTLPDLIAWDEAVRTPPERFRGMFASMAEPGRLATGEAGPYGAGMLVRTWRGLPVLEHGGFMLGFQHHWMYFPEQQTSVILMTSNADLDFFVLRDGLAELALGTVAPSKTPQEAASSPPSPSTEIEPKVLPELETRLSGCFLNDEIPLAMLLDVAEGELFVHPSSFRRIRTNREGPFIFSALGGQLRLTLDVASDGTPAGFSMDHRDLGRLFFSRAEERHCAFAR